MRPALRGARGVTALLLIAGCASIPAREAAERTETVEAEGMAPADPKDVPGTRQRALAEAQRRAVEKVTGVLLVASTKVDAAVAVRQRILSNARGFIRSYRVLDEKMEAGFLKTRIRAVVSRRAPEGAAPAFSQPPPESPPVSVSISAVGPGAEAWGALAGAVVRGKLAAGGFSIVEWDPDPTRARPGLAVRGEVRTYSVRDQRLGAFVSYRAKVSVEVVEPGTGGVILDLSREASGLGVDKDSASSVAAENAGMLLGDAVAHDLTAYLWKRF